MLALIIILLFVPVCIWNGSCDFSDMCFSGTPAFEASMLNRSNLLNVWNAQWVTLPDQSEASANAKNKLILWFHSCVTVINKGKVCPLHSTTASGTAFPCRLRYPPLCCWGEAEHLFFCSILPDRVSRPAFFITSTASVYQLTFLRLKCSEMEAGQSYYSWRCPQLFPSLGFSTAELTELDVLTLRTECRADIVT